jgi:hypothetical protein
MVSLRCAFAGVPCSDLVVKIRIICFFFIDSSPKLLALLRKTLLTKVTFHFVDTVVHLFVFPEAALMQKLLIAHQTLVVLHASMDFRVIVVMAGRVK